MDRMLCADCAAASYSAAARFLVDRGERCSKCGGPLAVEPTEHEQAERVPVPERAERRDPTGRT